MYTTTRLEAHPDTGGMVGDWLALQADWFAINQAELERWVQVLAASVRIAAVDDRLDALVDELANLLLAQNNNDRSSPAFQLYFKDKRPSELRRPVLGKQLETMRGWLGSLTSSTGALQDLGNRMQAAIADADAAVSGLTAARQANHKFRTTGERKAFIDRCNALRKTTFGQLAEMPHARPDAGLPGSFAHQFFQPVSRTTPDVEPTAQALEAAILRRETELDELRAQLQEAQTREAMEDLRAEMAALEDRLARS